MATYVFMLRRIAVGALVGAVLAAAPALAQAPPGPTPDATPPATGHEPLESPPASPRAALEDFLALSRQGRYDEAARRLKLPDGQAGRGAELARRLKAVLDRHLWIDLETVSDKPEGAPQHGLPDGMIQLGTVPGPGGRPDPVRLVRLTQDGEPTWVFSPGTVGHIDAWFQALPDRWLRDLLPAVAFRPGPRELLWWQWVAVPLLAALALLLGRLLGWLTRTFLGRLAAGTRSDWDDALLARTAAPLTLLWTVGSAHVLLSLLGLYAPAEAFVREVLGASAVLAFFWALWRGVDVMGAGLRRLPWAAGNPSAQSLLSIGVRAGKALVMALGVIAAVAQLGFPVASLLAGMGIGGIALALAAQKTVENLFGSVALGVDQPFRVGDFVKIEDFVGTVEAIGLRSTRIRTLDRTLVSIPNGRLADMRLESLAARDRLRLACTLGLVYSTTAAQMRSVLEGLEQVLRSHPKIWPDALVVRFKEFGASSLDIEIMAWFQTSVWSEFQLIRQEVLLQFMDVVERAGSSIAFPTRTVHIVPETAPRSPTA